MDLIAANRKRPGPPASLPSTSCISPACCARAGLPVGPGHVTRCPRCRAIGPAQLARGFLLDASCRLRETARAQGDFDQAFHVFWKKPKMLEQLMQLLFHQITRPADEKAKKAGFRRLAEAMFDKVETQSRREEKHESLDFDATFSHSAIEVLRAKDFEQMTVAEQARAGGQSRCGSTGSKSGPGASARPSSASASICGAPSRVRCAPAATRSISNGANVRRHEPPLVVLCDISGSMLELQPHVPSFPACPHQ